MEKTSGRSAQFPTHYRVGSITDVFQVTRDVYWSPADGYGIERDHECLTNVPAEDVAKIEWFDKDGDYDKLLEAREHNNALNSAMPVVLCNAMWCYTDDQVFAEACEADKAATLSNGSGV